MGGGGGGSSEKRHARGKYRCDAALFRTIATRKKEQSLNLILLPTARVKRTEPKPQLVA